MINLSNNLGGSDTAIPYFAEILILDDNEFDRKRLRRALSHLPSGCTIAEAGSIEEFKHKVRETTYDIILIDYALADGDGLEAIEICKTSELNAEALFVMVTGNDSSGLAVSALKTGFDDYLLKDNMSFEVITGLTVQSKEKNNRGMKDINLPVPEPFSSTSENMTLSSFLASSIEEYLAPKISNAIDEAVNKARSEQMGDSVVRFLNDFVDEEDIIFLEQFKNN